MISKFLTRTTKVAIFSGALLISTVAFAQKDTIIVLDPSGDAGTYQDIMRSESINKYDAQKMAETIKRELTGSLVATGKFHVKVIPGGNKEKKIKAEIARADAGEDTQWATTYMEDNKARYLINTTLTAVSAQRTTTEMVKDVYNYRDSGSISLSVEILDVGLTSGPHEGDNAGHEIFHDSVYVEYKTPYRRLRNHDTQHVDSRFWNEMVKKATTQVASKLLDTASPLMVSSVNDKGIIISRGSETSDIERNDQYNILDDNKIKVGIAKVISVGKKESRGLILTENGAIQNGYTLEKIVKEDDDSTGELF